MTILETEIIDFIVRFRGGDAFSLLIADHLAWEAGDGLDHVALLRRKIDAYLHFVLTGALYEQLPEARGQAVEIVVVGQHKPNEQGRAFYRQAAAVAQRAGCGLAFLKAAQLRGKGTLPPTCFWRPDADTADSGAAPPA